MNGDDIEVTLLGRFEVALSGEPIAAGAWSRRHAAALVKLLALAPGRRLHREQVLDRLWPTDPIDTAIPKLHKAAHFARRTIGRDDAIVLRDQTVALFPDSDVVVDALVFECRARAALTGGDDQASRRAIDCYGGELLPDDPYDDWLTERRHHLALLHRELLRSTRQWSALVLLDPSDEEAQLELIRAHVDAGRRSAALRQFARMERLLQRELGVAPSPDAIRLRDELLVALREDGRRAGDHRRHCQRRRPVSPHGPRRTNR